MNSTDKSTDTIADNMTICHSSPFKETIHLQCPITLEDLTLNHFKKPLSCLFVVHKIVFPIFDEDGFIYMLKSLNCPLTRQPLEASQSEKRNHVVGFIHLSTLPDTLKDILILKLGLNGATKNDSDDSKFEEMSDLVSLLTDPSSKFNEYFNIKKFLYYREQVSLHSYNRTTLHVSIISISNPMAYSNNSIMSKFHRETIKLIEDAYKDPLSKILLNYLLIQEDYLRKTPLCYLVGISLQHEVVEKLIVGLTDDEFLRLLSISDNSSTTLIHHAFKYQLNAVMQKFIEYANHEANKDTMLTLLSMQNNEGKTPLHFNYSVESASVDIMEKLTVGLSSDDFIKLLSIRDNNDMTVFHYAFKNRSNKVMKMFIEYANQEATKDTIITVLSLRNNECESLLYYAAIYASFDIVEKLIKYLSVVDIISLLPSPNSADSIVFYRVFKKHPDLVLRKVIDHFDQEANSDTMLTALSFRNYEGKTLLHYAVEYASDDIMEALIEGLTGNNFMNLLSIPNSTGSSVFHHAFRHRSNAVIQKFIDHADQETNKDAMLTALSFRNNKGKTLLHYAVEYMSDDIVEKIIANLSGDDFISLLSMPDTTDSTVLHCAFKHQSNSVMQKFIDHVNQIPNKNAMLAISSFSNKDGETPLYYLVDQLSKYSFSRAKRILMSYIVEVFCDLKISKVKEILEYDGKNKITNLLEHKPCFTKVLECGSKSRDKNMTSRAYIKAYYELIFQTERLTDEEKQIIILAKDNMCNLIFTVDIFSELSIDHTQTIIEIIRNNYESKVIDGFGKDIIEYINRMVNIDKLKSKKICLSFLQFLNVPSKSNRMYLDHALREKHYHPVIFSKIYGVFHRFNGSLNGKSISETSYSHDASPGHTLR